MNKTVKTGLHQTGYNLIELMISMLIGLFIIATVTQIFISSNRSNQLNYQYGLMQESARAAITAITRDARMAGFTGCGSDVPIANALLESTPDLSWITAEQPLQGVPQSDLQTALDPQVMSEGLVIFKLDPDKAFQLTAHDIANTTMTFSNSVNSELSQGEAAALLRQDCSQIALIGLSTVGANTITYTTASTGDFRNCTTLLKGSFRCYDGSVPTAAISFLPGTLRTVNSVVYFVKMDGTRPTLFRREANNPEPQAVVDNIEAMRIYYGVDSDNDGVANRYLRAGNLPFRDPSWNNVTAIRIHLLVRSHSELLPELTAPQQHSYLFDGVETDQNDNLLRREYVMTVALRK